MTETNATNIAEDKPWYQTDIVTIIDSQGNLSSLPDGEYIDHICVWSGTLIYVDKDSGEPSIDLYLRDITNRGNKYPLFLHICPFDPLSGNSAVNYVLQIIDDRTVYDICVNTNWEQLHQKLSEEAKEKLKEVKEELNGRIS